jgi:hypothetical protein
MSNQTSYLKKMGWLLAPMLAAAWAYERFGRFFVRPLMKHTLGVEDLPSLLEGSLEVRVSATSSLGGMLEGTIFAPAAEISYTCWLNYQGSGKKAERVSIFSSGECTLTFLLVEGTPTILRRPTPFALSRELLEHEEKGIQEFIATLRRLLADEAAKP